MADGRSGFRSDGAGLLGMHSQMLVEKSSKTPLFPYTLKPNLPMKGICSYSFLLQKAGCYAEPETAAASGSPGPQPKPDILARTDTVTWTHQLTQAAL